MTTHYPLPSTHSRPGYAFLITVLVIGVMATATAISLMLLGWAAEQNGAAVQQSAQAEAYAHTCIDRTIRTLRSDPTYMGNVTMTFPWGTCVIREIVQDGTNDRRVCVEGRSGQSVRLFQMRISELFPRVKMSDFVETDIITFCP